ncbi:hypothetical protein ACFWZ2_40310 [Streptomyces sp. NPDC059002]|uniref:hypothetical protein n=1 Tax=Streptomyces sp. NPDC059002 TaxID=3346690 RepID=UPI0036B64420
MAPRQLTTAAHARRVLFAPVPVAPTKPLTLSHVKGLLWSDVMHRATRLPHHVDLHYSWSVGVLNAQTLGFWDHLDRTRPGADFSTCDEEEVGALYVAYQRDRAPRDRLDPAVRRAAEAGGPPQPAGARILDLWGVRLRELGIADPGLRTGARPPLSLDQLVALLADLGLCVDHRRWNGPVYLDGTCGWLTLRLLVGADGTANYLAWLLRDLIPHLRAYNDLVLACDRDSLPRLRPAAAPPGQARRPSPPRRPRPGAHQRRPRPGPLVAARRLAGADRRGAGRAPSGPGGARRVPARAAPVLCRDAGPRRPAAAPRRAAEPLHGPGRTRAQGPVRPPGSGRHRRPAAARHARPHPYVDPYRLTTALLAQARRGGADGRLLNEVYV